MGAVGGIGPIAWVSVGRGLPVAVGGVVLGLGVRVTLSVAVDVPGVALGLGVADGVMRLGVGE